MEENATTTFFKRHFKCLFSKMQTQCFFCGDRSEANWRRLSPSAEELLGNGSHRSQDVKDHTFALAEQIGKRDAIQHLEERSEGL